MILSKDTYHYNSIRCIKEIVYTVVRCQLGDIIIDSSYPALHLIFGKVLACDSIDSLREIAECLSGGPSGEDAAAGDGLV